MSFFHPDFTVGIGIAPIQLALADFTAGRELHPALKTFFSKKLYHNLKANANNMH